MRIFDAHFKVVFILLGHKFKGDILADISLLEVFGVLYRGLE